MTPIREVTGAEVMRAIQRAEEQVAGGLLSESDLPNLTPVDTLRQDSPVKPLFDPANIHHITELNGGLVSAVSRAEVLADRYSSDTLRSLVMRIKVNMVSHKRKGAQERVSAIISAELKDTIQESILMRNLTGGKP